MNAPVDVVQAWLPAFPIKWKYPGVWHAGVFVCFYNAPGQNTSRKVARNAKKIIKLCVICGVARPRYLWGRETPVFAGFARENWMILDKRFCANQYSG
jgi:hypothetical protein